MTKYSFHSSAPDSWSCPRPIRDPSLRRHHYGKIQPMEGASDGFFARLLRAN